MTEASTRIDIPITSAPPVSNSTSNSNTSSALLRKYPMIEADQKRRRYRRIIFICVSLVLIALGATFALFAALGLLSNENGFLSSKSRLPGGMAHPDSEIGKDTKSVNINLEKSTDNWDWSSSLIVISIDGFHPSYLMNTNAQHLRRFGDRGYVLPHMNPQVPSSTYPNHFSLVTGVYPSVHGIVSNEFRDPRLNMTFTYKDPAVADLPEWWLSKPLWISAQEQGKKSGVCFWPGSEAEIQGSRPTYYRKFDSKMSMKARFDTLLEWIDLPVNERPSLFMTYYEKVDQMGHLYGTKSAELDVALQEFDDAFGQFINDLESRRIRDVVNILILSDHGMQDVSYHVDLIGEGLIKQNEIEHIDYTPLTYIRPVNKEMVPDLVERLKEGSKNRYNVFERKDLPEEWHLKDQERVSEIVVAFEPGYTAVSPTWKNMPKGAHGYYLNNAAGDLVNDDMRALFMVSSPRILQEKIFVKRYDNLVVAQPPNRLYNLEVKVFENLDVYPLMCNFLHILAAPNNGTTFLVDTLLNHS